MGLIGWILNHEQSYENGSDWAETLIEVDADVSPGQVERMAEDLSGNPRAFYALAMLSSHRLTLKLAKAS